MFGNLGKMELTSSHSTALIVVCFPRILSACHLSLLLMQRMVVLDLKLEALHD